jgi:MFS family permease
MIDAVGQARALTSSAPPLLSEQKLGAIHYRIVALCFAAWTFDFYDLILYSFLLVPIARDLHLSDAQSSLALGLSLAMTALGGVLFGFVGDRFGRKPVIIVTVLIYGVGTTLCGSAHSLGELLAYRAFTALGIGGEWAAGQSMIAESVPADRRARFAAYVQVGAPLGGLMAAVVGGYLEPGLGWRMAFALSAVPAFVIALLVWRWMPESDVWQRHAKRRWMTRADWRALEPYRRVVTLLFVILLVNSTAYWFTYSWMPAYLRTERGLSSQAAGSLMIRMQYGGIFGYSIFGWLADRCGRRPSLCAFGLLMAAGLLPVTVWWERAATIPGLVTSAFVVAGIGTGTWAGVGPIISELLPTRVRNSALGLLLNVTRGIQFFTPLAITWLSASLGLASTLAIGAIFSSCGAALVWTLPETRGRDITLLDHADRAGGTVHPSDGDACN